LWNSLSSPGYLYWQISFDGPDKNENPGEKGYLRDGIHTNPSDDAVIADLLRDIGYDPVVP